jgi:FkbM family methyltransferase
VTIVVDIGASTRAGEQSLVPLIKRFDPDYLFAFDPLWPELPFKGEQEFSSRIGKLTMTQSRKAAWTYDGYIGFRKEGDDGIRSHVDPQSVAQVPCFDLANFLLGLPSGVILKMDCEGAEYTLIPHLIETGAIEKVELLLIEWHKPEGGVLVTNGVAPIHVPVPWEVWG